MCLDITKYITHIEKKELDNIDNITRVINSYELNDLVNFIEFAGEDEDLHYNTINKCPSNCPDDVRSVYHAYRHYKYLLELTFVKNLQVKILRVFFKIHQDFDLEEYLVKWNGELIFNIKHLSSAFNYYTTLDFSANYLIIKKSFYII